MTILMPGSNTKVLLSCVFMSYILVFQSGCGKLPAEHKIIKSEEGEIRIHLSEIRDGRAHFFTYKKSGKRINFLVRTDGKDNLSAYFDACFTCYKYKKGYRVEGTDLVCNECNLRFRLADEKWDNSKGCSPILIKSKIGKDSLIIKTDDIEKGGKLF